jgi:hypothetical protein
MSMIVHRWNQTRIALFDAILGAAYVYATTEGTHPVAEMAGALFGGAMGGALLFGLFAAARNWMVAASGAWNRGETEAKCVQR